MPLGVAFDYAALGNMSTPVQTQYESEMFSLIGQNNKTALINVNLANSEMSAAAVSSLQGLEKNIQNLALPSGLKVYYGGSTQQTYDSESFLGGVLPEGGYLVVGVISTSHSLQGSQERAPGKFPWWVPLVPDRWIMAASHGPTAAEWPPGFVS